MCKPLEHCFGRHDGALFNSLLGLFIIKFGANVMLAMHPDLSGDRLFAVSVSLAYGAFSGIFLARGFAMWRIARQAQYSSIAY